MAQSRDPADGRAPPGHMAPPAMAPPPWRPHRSRPGERAPGSGRPGGLSLQLDRTFKGMEHQKALLARDLHDELGGCWWGRDGPCLGRTAHVGAAAELKQKLVRRANLARRSI